MRADEALKLLKDLEAKVSKLYTHFGTVFAGDEDAAELFELLSMDEDSYSSVVQYQMRLLKQEPGAFGSVDINETELKALMGFIDNAMASNAEPTLKQAVELALEIEGSEAKTKYRNLLVQSNPKLNELLRNMGVPDAVHSKRLTDFVIRRDMN